MPKAGIIPTEDPVTETGSAEGRDEPEEARRPRISLAAYYWGLRRGFAPGGEIEDWLAAEKEDQAGQGNSPDKP